MSRKSINFKRLVTGVFILSVPLVVGCGGVSSKEVAALEKQRQATEGAEKKVASLEASVAAKEAEVASKKATKAALEERLAETKFNLDN